MTETPQPVTAEQAEPEDLTDGRALMRAFVPASPFVAKLGVSIQHLAPGSCVLRLPWDPANTTVGDMVHGGAIAALLDMTLMVSAWTTRDQLPDNLRGVTVHLASQFLAPAYSTDLTAHGTVRRTGKSLVFADVTITDAHDTEIATASGVYKIG